MRQNLKRRLAIGLMVAVVGSTLVGCGNFRQQALEAQTRLNDVVERAEIAEDAAARNAGRIIELEHRIEALEASLAALQETKTND
jgi:BMFP domain-containing protein YqiC